MCVCCCCFFVVVVVVVVVFVVVVVCVCVLLLFVCICCCCCCGGGGGGVRVVVVCLLAFVWLLWFLIPGALLNALHMPSIRNQLKSRIVQLGCDHRHCGCEQLSFTRS